MSSMRSARMWRVSASAIGSRRSPSASYAEYDVANADAVVQLPAALAGQPFPGEPLGCAMNIFRRSDIGAGQTVAIIGIGFLGAILTRLASDAGRAGDRHLAAAVLARHGPRHGARPRPSRWTITRAIIEQVKEMTGGACASG